VLRKIVLPKKQEVTGDWRKLHTEELHEFESPADIIGIIKLRTV
jgi:hypothetical protein